MSRATRSKTERKTTQAQPVGLSAAGSKIVAAFEEAIEVMQKEGPATSKLTARTYRAHFVARDYGPDDVRRVRGVLEMSQAVFAKFLGVDANTVRSWEQGTRPPSLIARRFMEEIEADPNYWKQRLVQSLKNTFTDATR